MTVSFSSAAEKEKKSVGRTNRGLPRRKRPLSPLPPAPPRLQRGKTFPPLSPFSLPISHRKTDASSPRSRFGRTEETLKTRSSSFSSLADSSASWFAVGPVPASEAKSLSPQAPPPTSPPPPLRLVTSASFHPFRKAGGGKSFSRTFLAAFMMHLPHRPPSPPCALS